MPILVVALATLGLGFFLFSQTQKKEGGGNWVSFFSKGKEEGFSLKEIEILRQLAVQCSLDDPLSLFWSQNQLDICIHSLVRKIRMSGESEEQGTQAFLSKLYDYRKKLELNKRSDKNSGITNSHQIGDGQVLKIIIPGTKGVFMSQVIRNTTQYIAVSRPVDKKNSSSRSWQGSKISVYFWKDDDAGYSFDSEVEDEIYSKGISSLRITHTEKLLRTQKRKSIRVKMHKAAFLYLVSTEGEPHKLELDPGLKCFLEDLSDTGYAVTVGGKTSDGLRVKVQFALENAPVCVSGTVRSTSYNEETNRSMLHIEADPLPVEMRNHILGEVFGTMIDEYEEDLPFRILDDEAASIGGQNDSLGTTSESDDDTGTDNAGTDTNKLETDDF